MKKANITELFRSIQGEGPYIGEEQFFVRFKGCNLSCKFCDEKEKKGCSEYSSQGLYDQILKLGSSIVSFTGGEPLMCIDFLKEIIPLLKDKGIKIYLETNGILKKELLEVIDFIDVISMDFKLPSSTGLKPYWDEHREFLKEAVKKDVFVKVVISGNTVSEDISEAINIVSSIDKNIPFIFQPVSYNKGVEKIRLMPDFFSMAKEKLDNVRIIPQVHKLLGIR